MWYGNTSLYWQEETKVGAPLLPSKVMRLEEDFRGTLFLEVMRDEFTFPYKIYGKDGFPERVIKTFNETRQNIGVLLSGLKGTGKTVQAEQICNLSKMPVIIVSQNIPNVSQFLASIRQNIVVFIDEYEKVFGDSSALLTLMDGVISSPEYRRIFLLTTNENNISDALINRPGRIRYHKTFGNIHETVVKELIEDLLLPERKNFEVELMDYLRRLDICTLDIAKVIIDEVNRFNEGPTSFSTIINATAVSFSVYSYWDVYNKSDNKLVVERGEVYKTVDFFAKNTYLDLVVGTGRGRMTKSLGFISKASRATKTVKTELGEFILVRRDGLGGMSKE